MKRTILFILIATVNPSLFAQAGSLDNTFGIGGKVTTNFGYSEDVGYSMAVQSDGKIVVAGTNGYPGDLNFAIARYNSDGTLDNSFDVDGKVTTDFGVNSQCRSVTIQSDGKIVAVGLSNNDFALVRYNTNGNLDSTFDSDGKVITDFGSEFAGALAVVVQADGKILAAGEHNAGTNSNFAIIRYDANGSLDLTFGVAGVVITDVQGSQDNGSSIVLQADGRILVGGLSTNGANYDFGLVRYNIDGSLDASFDTDGKVTADFIGNNDHCYSIAIQADGKILLAGSNDVGISADFALVRLNTDGSLDNSFDVDGKVTTDLGSSTDYARSVALQSDGKILVAGMENWDFALVRYNSDGSLDVSFDLDGIVSTSFGPIGFVSARGFSIAIQSDSKILLSGDRHETGPGYDFAIARYNVNPVGLENNLIETDLTIFPNPTTELINISMSKQFTNASLKIFNEQGQILIQKKDINGDTYVLNVSELPIGIYVLEVTDGMDVSTTLFVKK